MGQVSRKLSGGVRHRVWSLAALLPVLELLACDDAVPGRIGGLVVVIRPFASPAQSRMDEVDRVEITYTRVEALHRASLDAPERTVVLIRKNATS